jgi:hypothetical protein
MKKIFGSLVIDAYLFFIRCVVAAAVLFFVGCQENFITDPILSEAVDKVQVGTGDTYFHGIILLEGALNDPYPVGNSFYRISGQIEYEQKSVHENPMLIVTQRYASLHFSVNADLQHVCTVCTTSEEDAIAGFISAESEDLVALVGSSVSLLEKTYTIQGRDDGMTLKVRFLVTANGTELSAVWLALPSQILEAADIINY